MSKIGPPYTYFGKSISYICTSQIRVYSILKKVPPIPCPAGTVDAEKKKQYNFICFDMLDFVTVSNLVSTSLHHP